MCLEEKTTDFKIVFHEKQEKHDNEKALLRLRTIEY